MKKIDNKNTPQVSGIDALYYFAQSGGGYDNYFEDIINQIEGKKQEFSSFSIAYADTDIIITLNDINIKYSGMGRDGFLWFNHEFFRIGFKDSEKAQNIQNIRVQLNAIGIYTIGIESLLEYVNEQFLKGALLSERNFLITRIDVNMFIQHDFKYLRKEMILSKKKNHSANIGERSSGYELETYYVGKNPFMLRIYNKLKELESASQIKRELMYNYFGVNGLDVEKPIFNVEFELHREFLKRYGIETVKDALGRAKSLFELGCDLIKLLDISTLTDAQINSSNRKRADTLPIWQYISTHYDNKSFMQLSTPLEKIEKISYRYTLEDARKPIKRHINRLLLHDNNPTSLYFIELLQDAKEEFDAKLEMKKVHDEEKTKENNKPTFADELKTYSDYGIQELERRISKEMRGVMPDDALYDEYVYKYSAIHDELVKRGLVEFPF
jgi:hypothetical protein